MADKSLTSEDLETVFIDVRKAYRLLHHFQRRVMDLAKHIGEVYLFDYLSGHTLFSDKLKEKNPLHFWAWDYMPGYNHFYAFKERKIASGQKAQLGFIVISDTGYYDGNEKISFHDKNKNNLQTFSSPEKSKTQVILLLRNDYVNPKWHYQALYKSTSEEIIFKEKEGNKFLIAKKYLFSAMVDEESTKEKLDDFANFCIDKGIRILPEKKEN